IERLDAINAELSSTSSRIASINAAISETNRRIADQNKAELAKEQIRRAELALPIAERLVERGRRMDKALQDYIAVRAALQPDLAEIRKLGAPIVSADLAAINLRTSHDAAFVSLDRPTKWDRHSPFVAPNRRHSFEQLAAGWALPARKWLAAKLNKTVP